MATEKASSAAIYAGVGKLSAQQLLLLYQALENADDATYASFDQDIVEAINTRAGNLLDNDKALANSILDEYGTLANTNYEKYQSELGQALTQIDQNAREENTWRRVNYPALISEWNETADLYSQVTHSELADFESAFASDDNGEAAYNALQTAKEYAEKTAVDSQERADAVALAKRLSDIYQEVYAHSTVGDDNVFQNNGMKEYDDKSIDTYRGSGTNGDVDDLEGIGGSSFGDGVGAGGNGRGNGTGFGNGDGDGDGAPTSRKGGYNSDGTPIEAQSVSQTDNSSDANAIASYLSMINDDVPINHIFHNSFYQNEPVAHWSFSIDFIPAVQLLNNNINLYEIGQTLTKAVIAANVPDRNVKSTVSHYKGMTIELPARAKTAGTLAMRFAENEEFEVSTILNQLYQFARSDTYFERIDNILENLSSEEEIVKYTQLLRAYRQAIPDSGHLYNILVKMYKMKDAQAFSEDNESVPSFVYFFVGCDLQTVDKIDFDYDNDKPIDVSCVWLYQYFEELTYDEYKQRYGAGAQPVSTDYNPNGKVDAMLESMEGNPNAHKEAVEYSWNEDIKRDNLSMMADEHWEERMELAAMEDLE